MKKWLILLVAVIMLPQVSRAASYYMDSRLQTQVRQNSLSEREVPLGLYLDTGLADLPRGGTVDVSLRNDHTFNIGKDEFDLYQAVFRVRDLGKIVDISAGRQFISPGFHAYLLDGVETKIGGDDWPVLIGIIGGVPRSIETGDFHGDIGLVTGTTVELQGFENAHAKLSIIYDKIELKKKDWKQNETVLVGIANTYQFDAESAPYIYNDVEYDTADKIIETGFLGFSLQPHRKVYWNMEGGHYNTNRSWNRSTVFGLYSSGPFYQARTGVSVTALESAGALEDLVFTGGYAYQRLEISSGTSKNGHIADGGVNFHIAPINMDANVAYRFYDSFGGRAHDVQAFLHDEPIDVLSVDIGANYTKYAKVTNEDTSAVSAFLMTGVTVFKNFVLSAAGEYLRNDTFDNEWRATAVLSYRLEGKL